MAKKGSLFTVGTLLSSFFGAAMIAGAFAYYNHKFTEYKFVNFKDFTFYEEKVKFIPTKEKYLVVFYSSKTNNIVEQIKKLDNPLPILAVDYSQKRIPSTSDATFIRSGTGTTLKFIQRFNIYNIPTIFIIKKFKDNLYKQDSMIHIIKDLDALPVITKALEEDKEIE
ncbi:MAG: hypothetical protein GQ570_05675 [Helicobacteraceae bacterium]|nr:hypothetical protein [Helicobacteraceae bacterium]